MDSRNKFWQNFEENEVNEKKEEHVAVGAAQIPQLSLPGELLELRFTQGKLRGRGEGDDTGSHPRLLIICQSIGEQRVDDSLLRGVPAMASQNLQSLHGYTTIHNSTSM